MSNICYTGINIPEPQEEDCSGNYTKLQCVYSPIAIPSLSLPANTKLTEIVEALLQKIEDLQNQINELTNE
jgi:hypothetical protein